MARSPPKPNSAAGKCRAFNSQYCSMAFDNAGASWVATEREVRNPYFGDAMLKCGKVTEEL